MASLLNLKNKQKIALQAHHIFGRQPDTSTTQILSPDVSRTHATIMWEGEQWKIKDTSCNGTYLGNKRIAAGEYVALSIGDEIRFGRLDADAWQVCELTEPRCFLAPMQVHLPRIELVDICAIPSENEPEFVIYKSAEQWVLEAEGRHKVLSTGDIVGNRNHQWRYIDARPTLTTRNGNHRYQPSKLTDICFVFHVSQNEEHVSLSLKSPNKSISLGERCHHYLLLLLARQRVNDKQSGVQASEQGWIKKDVLVKMLGMQENHINIQIFRFRKQVIEALPSIAALHEVIERRTGALRLAHDNFVVRGGSAGQVAHTPTRESSALRY
ncbi:MAG TPA: FHA domain-containing protein [Marinagarivorans sp.]